MKSIPRLEITFKLKDGRKVIVERTRKENYKVRVLESVKGKMKVVSTDFVDYDKFDRKIDTYKEAMEICLSKTVYNLEGADSVCVRLLD